MDVHLRAGTRCLEKKASPILYNQLVSTWGWAFVFPPDKPVEIRSYGHASNRGWTAAMFAAFGNHAVAIGVLASVGADLDVV